MKNEYRIDKKEIMSWQKKLPLTGVNVLLFILWGFIGLIGISMLFVLARNGGRWISWLFAIYFVFASVYSIFFRRFVAAYNRYKMLSKTYGVPEWTRTIEFAEEEIIVSDHTSISRFQYNNIKKITEKNNVIVIFMSNHLLLPLYKDTFVEGNWEACKERIAAKQ